MEIIECTCESSSVNIASKANIFGAATVGLRSSAEEDCPAVGSTSVTCFFLLSALKKLPPSPGDTFSITFTCKQKIEPLLKTMFAIKDKLSNLLIAFIGSLIRRKRSKE